MDFNLVTTLESCYSFIQGSQDQVNLVFYSHLTSAIIALLIGIFVFVKDRESLQAKILLGLSTTFSLWTFFSLLTWISYSSDRIMLVWSLLGVLTSLLFILCLYFTYVFIDKNDITFSKKALFSLLLVPSIILAPTKFNLEGFSYDNCEAFEGSYYTNYYYFLGLFVFMWIFLLSIKRYRNAQRDARKQIVLIAVGIELFLLAFFMTGFFSSLFDNFNMEIYGLFGMTFFMGVLAYLIVKFKAFNIKLIAAQALIVGLVILVGSQFFFVRNVTSQILTGVTLVIVGGMGIALIRSVKNEVKRKEELQMMSDKLSAANDQLRKLDNAKSEFISIASHQLRTPLTAIKGFISLMLEGAYGKVIVKQRDILGKIYQSNENLVHLVEDLLNVSRIESGRMEYKKEKFKITDLLQELYDNFMLIAKQKKLSLELKLPDGELPEVELDKNKAREVISNLIDNGLKYTPQGGVTVTASLLDGKNETEMLKEGDVSFPKIRIMVADTGVGIPAEEIPYLFAKFSRGKNPSRLSVGGTGLGLYVGKSMIENQGGKIWIESEGEGKGSRFIIDIPVAA